MSFGENLDLTQFAGSPVVANHLWSLPPSLCLNLLLEECHCTATSPGFQGGAGTQARLRISTPVDYADSSLVGTISSVRENK